MAMLSRINNDEMKRLYELSDLLCEIRALKVNPKNGALFSYDTSVGGKLIVQKLTFSLQSRWVTKASIYKQLHGVSYPPFSVFCDFMEGYSSMLNDPGLIVKSDTQKSQQQPRGQQKTFSVKRPI